MSEYEMASLHAELFNSVQQSLAIFITVLSGFLVMSYLAAHRLSRFTATICLIAFLGFEAVTLLGTGATLLSLRWPVAADAAIRRRWAWTCMA